VAKVLRRAVSPDGEGESLERELESAEAMRSAGISIPEVEGIFTVNIRWFSTAFGLLASDREALLMERLKGMSTEKALWTPHADHVRELYAGELAKCFRAGLYPEDHCYGGKSGSEYRNGIYDPALDKVFFVDFMKVRRIRPMP
jgi:hypothetical protein